MTTSNVRFVPKNDHDDATLSSTGAAIATGTSLENTQNTTRKKVVRTTSSSSFVIKGLLPSTRTVSHFSMHRHLCHAGNFRLELFSDAAWTTGTYDSTTVSATTYTSSDPYTWSTGTNDPYKIESASWLWFSEAVCRSYQLTLSGTPSQSYWEISRIWLGRYFQLALNVDQGYSLGWADLTDRNRSRGGSLRTNRGEMWRVMDFNLNSIEWNEGSTFQQFERNVGTGVEFLTSIFPGDGTSLERDHFMAGKFPNLSPVARYVTWLTKKVQIEES